MILNMQQCFPLEVFPKYPIHLEKGFLIRKGIFARQIRAVSNWKIFPYFRGGATGIKLINND